MFWDSIAWVTHPYLLSIGGVVEHSKKLEGFGQIVGTIAIMQASLAMDKKTQTVPSIQDRDDCIDALADINAMVAALAYLCGINSDQLQKAVRAYSQKVGEQIREEAMRDNPLAQRH